MASWFGVREIAKHNGKHNHGFGFGFEFENFLHHTNQYTLHYARAARVGSVAVATTARRPP